MMQFEMFKPLETSNPKLRLVEVQRGVDELPTITFEAFLTQELIDWMREDKGIESRFIDKLEGLLNANKPLR